MKKLPKDKNFVCCSFLICPSETLKLMNGDTDRLQPAQSRNPSFSHHSSAKALSRVTAKHKDISPATSKQPHAMCSLASAPPNGLPADGRTDNRPFAQKALRHRFPLPPPRSRNNPGVQANGSWRELGGPQLNEKHPTTFRKKLKKQLQKWQPALVY